MIHVGGRVFVTGYNETPISNKDHCFIIRDTGNVQYDERTWADRIVGYRADKVTVLPSINDIASIAPMIISPNRDHRVIIECVEFESWVTALSYAFWASTPHINTDSALQLVTSSVISRITSEVDGRESSSVSFVHRAHREKNKFAALWSGARQKFQRPIVTGYQNIGRVECIVASLLDTKHPLPASVESVLSSRLLAAIYQELATSFFTDISQKLREAPHLTDPLIYESSTFPESFTENAFITVPTINPKNAKHILDEYVTADLVSKFPAFAHSTLDILNKKKRLESLSMYQILKSEYSNPTREFLTYSTAVRYDYEYSQYMLDMLFDARRNSNWKYISQFRIMQ